MVSGLILVFALCGSETTAVEKVYLDAEADGATLDRGAPGLVLLTSGISGWGSPPSKPRWVLTAVGPPSRGLVA